MAAGGAGPLTLTRLHGAERGLAAGHVASQPEENMYILSKIEAAEGAPELLDGAHLLAAVEGGEVRGVAYWKPGGLVVIGRADPEAQQLFAKVLGSAPARSWRVLVSPESDAARFVEASKAMGAEIELDRPQAFYLLERPAAVGLLGDGSVRAAVAADLETLCEMSLAQAEEDLGIPRSIRPLDRLRERLLRQIAAGELFVAGPVGAPEMRASVTVRSKRFGAQIEGVFTVRERRNRGIATRALAAIASDLLGQAPFVCLHVSETNLPARACYERVGFKTRSMFRLTRKKSS